MTTEELMLRAAENSDLATLNALLKDLRELNASQDLSQFAESLQLLWEGFPEEPTMEEAQFCLEVARLRVPDNAMFRQVLAAAVKATLPPYLCKAGVVRAIGLRDSSVPPNEIVRRIERLMAIKSGVVTFIFDSNRWGTVSNVDALNATVAVNLQPGGALGIGLDKVLQRGYFFKTSVATNKLMSAQRLALLSSTDFRKIVSEQSLVHLSEGAVRSLAEKLLVPTLKSPAEFEAWYSEETAVQAAPAPVVRGSAKARSLKELDVLLDQELKDSLNTVDEAQVAAFAAFFDKLKKEVAGREAKALAVIVAKLAERSQEESWGAILSGLKGKAPFWAAEDVPVKLEELEVWGKLAVKISHKLAVVTKSIFGAEYLAWLAVRLPLKSLNVCAEILPAELVDEVFAAPPLMTADVVMWAWKNRKNHPALEVLLKPENVVTALNYSRLPKEWGAAQRDLHSLLLDKDDFQKYIVAASDDVQSLVGSLAGASTFTNGERQSLMVKLSRHSSKIREHLEAGAATKMMSKNADENAAPAANEPIYTSLASHRRLLQELQDIINIHQPENREALKTARAHGDFRENSEFDAAKERRNFLSRRRSELEDVLGKVNALDFRNIQAGKFVDLGVTVELEINGAGSEVYYFLGAWDGDPDKNYLSYKTKLGEALRNRQVGDAVVLPDGRKATVKAISALPESVLAEMI